MGKPRHGAAILHHNSPVGSPGLTTQSTLGWHLALAHPSARRTTSMATAQPRSSARGYGTAMAPASPAAARWSRGPGTGTSTPVGIAAVSSTNKKRMSCREEATVGLVGVFGVPRPRRCHRVTLTTMAAAVPAQGTTRRGSLGTPPSLRSR